MIHYSIVHDPDVFGDPPGKRRFRVVNTHRIISIPDVHSRRRLDGLTVALQNKALDHINDCANAGFYIRITHGLRTWAEQDQLYALGRTAPGKRVTNAKGGYSWHNFGRAYDIVILDWDATAMRFVANWNTNDRRWKKAGELGKSLGLTWGGDFKTLVDYPHFQLTQPYKTLAEARKAYANGNL